MYKHTFRCMKLLPFCCVVAAGITGCVQDVQIYDDVLYNQNIPYGLGYVGSGDVPSLKTLYMDILAPADITPGDAYPAVLMIHGGAFNSGAKDDVEMVRLANEYAHAGYVCFLIDYRLQPDDPPAPSPYDQDPLEAAEHAAFTDAKTALRHITASSEQYGIDPKRIAVMGQSAGAYCALAAGISRPEYFHADRPDLEVPEENNPETTYTVQAIIDFWGSADLFLNEFDPDDPPVLIVHGTLDNTVPYEYALAIVNECETNGIPYEFYPIPWRGHAPWSAKVNGQDLTALSLAFLHEFMP